MGLYDYPPRLSHDYLASLARWVRARCRRPQLCPNPLDYAARLGLDAIPLHDHEALVPDRREIVFHRSADPRMQGGVVLVGLARCVLIMAGAAPTVGDVIGLARELALPSEAAAFILRDVALMLAPHAPVEMIDAQIGLFSRRSRE